MEELSIFEKYLPAAVLIAVVLVIILVEVSINLVEQFEDWIEKKKGKQISFFDHKKIWLNLFYDIVVGVALSFAGFIQWKELPFYMFVIMGMSTFFYEAIIKRLKK